MSMKFVLRLKVLEDFKSALTVFETKVKFTYEPLPEIFLQMSKNDFSETLSNMFMLASSSMKYMPASEAWCFAIDQSNLEITKEDIVAIKNLSKLLGQTDVDGQVAQIKVTNEFLNKQIRNAVSEKDKNAKLYSKLGIVGGLMLVILLI